MAQDAELKLKVSLDLAFFRQQLSTVGAQLGGQSIPIAIKFDKKAIADQYRLLDTYIRGKKFTVELNLAGGLTKNEFEKIKGRLDDLRDLRKVEIPVGVKNGATGKDVDKVVTSIKERLANNQQIKQGGGKLRIETSVKPSITNQDIADFKKAVKDKLSKIGALEIPTKLDVPKVEDLLKALQKNINRQKPLLAKTSIKPSILSADVKAFKKAVESKLSGITVKINAELETIGGGKTKAQIEKEVLAGLERIQQIGAERMGGGVTEPARRESLRQSLQGRDIGELKDIGRQLGVTGVGKFRNTQNLIERIVTEASIEMITKYLDPQAVMRNPDRSGLNKVLDTFARGLFNMLGMDVASMRQQAAQRRALPGVNFPATVPSRPVSIGPSSTGRILSAGAGPAGMIGAAQAPVGLLPSITRRSSIQAGIENIFAAGGPRFPEGTPGKLALSTEALQARVNAQLAEYFKVVEATVREVFNPQDLKRALNIFSYLPQALRDAESRTRQARIGITSAQGIAGLLPAAAGRAPSTYSTGAIGGESREQMMARRTAEAYARSALRGMDVMGGGAGRPPSPYSYAYRSARPTSAIVPYAAGGAMVPTGAAVGDGGMVPPGGGGGGRGGLGGFGGFGRALGSVNLPGAGTIRELGSEFAFATKQVLLFGQAYKMLGFIQAFPGQVGQAVAQLQSFRNTLNTVATSADDASASNQLILDLVEKYNVPLQSARDGFTKLYASMAPAGFSGDEIRDLFTGITQAAATFGMSADKVDRVNYAFAQMASKGQVMSEELKGQLGDVLPGAMAIFAEAAGFKGPKAIQDFSAALEDGIYKGEAMNVLLKNVGIVMKQEFGPGAEGAARTFQGVINRMQNSMQLLYESFEPMAVGFLNGVVMPLTNGIKQVSDGFTAFFAGTAAKTTGGGLLVQELNSLRPAFEGIRQNVSELINQFGQFAQAGLQLGKVLLQIAGNPLIGYMLRVYANVLVLTTAVQLLNLRALIPMIANLTRSAYALIAFTAQCVRAGQSLQVMGLMARTAGTTLRAFFASTGVGLVLVGLGMLIERIMTLNQKMDETRQKASAAGNAIRMMSGTEALAAERTYTGHAKSLEGLNKQLQEGQLKGKAWIAVNRQQAEALRAAGVIPSEVRGQAQVQPFRIAGAYQRLEQLRGEASYRRRQLDFEEQQAQQAGAPLAAIPSVADEEKAGKGKSKGGRKSLDQLVSSQILMLAEAEKAAIKLSLAQTKALAPDTTQAQRILDFYAKFRNNLVDIQAIEGQIAAAERNRSKWIKDYGMTGEEIDRNLSELRNQLKIATIDLAATEQDYRNQAKADAAEEAAEMEEKLRKQKELNRLIEDAQIAAGIISPQQAAILQQRRGFEDAQARVQQEGTPEQLAQLIAAQALIPEAGSLRETINTLREELDKLTSSQELVKASALSIGDAFSKSFKDAITGASSAQEALAGFFQSVASSFADMAAQMIQKMIQIYILDQLLNILPGGGMFKGNASIQGGGFGSFSGGAFGIDAGGSLGQVGQNLSIRPFANGGIVTGPTMGLIGEGRYNEAVVPLPDGKSIPVDLGGSAGDSGVNIVVNVDAKGTNVQGDNGMGRQLGAAVSAAVQAELIKQKRPGGLLA